MNPRSRLAKRSFDIVCAILGLALTWPILAICWMLARLDTSASGFYRQQRVGRNGELFQVVKLRTMRPADGTTVTTADDDRITPLGARLRRYKLDELPQLWNVLVGEMSLVGPRPDVPGFLDELTGPDRELLRLRPGITGPATLKYRDEEELLAGRLDPERYNADVIWPDKVRINRAYLHDWSLRGDLRYVVETVVGERISKQYEAEPVGARL